MKNLTVFNMLLSVALVTGVASANQQQASAVVLNGVTHFERPPSLVDSATTQNTILANSVTYYFTLEVPETAGEPLKTIRITQEDATTAIRRVSFETDETTAFLGTRGDRGDAVSIQQTQYDPDTQTVTVTFAEPVAPGSLVTLALEPERNPRMSGTYLFGVTAYPDGDPSQGQFLGYGRFQFYDRGDFSPFFND